MDHPSSLDNNTIGPNDIEVLFCCSNQTTSMYKRCAREEFPDCTLAMLPQQAVLESNA